MPTHRCGAWRGNGWRADDRSRRFTNLLLLRQVSRDQGTVGVDRSNGASGLVLQPDGKIVMAGFADTDGAGNFEFEVVRVIGDTIFEDGFCG